MCGHGANSGSPWPKGVTIANASIAPSAGKVNRQWAAYRRDTRDGYPRRPDVLSKMPRSCKVTFDVLRSFAMGEAVELSIRELAEMCRLSYTQTRRALRRLEGAKLIVWRRCGPGRAHRSIFQVRWAPPSFPQRNDPSYARVTLKPQREAQDSFAKAKTLSSTKATPQLMAPTWQPSERAIRWALARARDRLWGLPKPRRERAVNALAKAFRWAARQSGPWDRDRWRRFVFGAIAQFESGPDGLTQARRRPYGWAMRCAREALAELSRGEEHLRATEELLGRIRRERDAAKRGWTVNSDPLDGKRMPVGGGESRDFPTSRAWPSPSLSRPHPQNRQYT